MGEEESEVKIPEVEENGTSALDKSGQVLTDKKEENNEVDNVDRNTKGNEESGAEKMDEDPKVIDDKESTEEKANMGEEEAEEEQPKNEVVKEETAPEGDQEAEEKEDAKEESEKVDGSEEKQEKIEEVEEDVEKQEKIEEVEEDVDGSREKIEEAEEDVDGSEEKTEEVEEVDGSEEKEEQFEETEEKALKIQRKGKSGGEKKNGREKVEKKGVVKQKKEPEPRTPVSDRPQRERKSVERLVISFEKDAGKEFHIEKGRGTPLKDIPNVAFKLSRKKTEDTFKLLHSILFGRRGKAVQIKSNISRFSGFVWQENEEKHRIKVKEKFDKCNKEKLLEFCDVLDIPVSKAATKKEDVVVKLIDFLVAPHATSAVLLAEKEKESKSKKRKRVTKSSASGVASSGRSAKSRKKAEGAPKAFKRDKHDSEDESEEEKEEEEYEVENANGILEKSDPEMPEHSESTPHESEEEDESEEDNRKRKRRLRKPSSNKKSAQKGKTKKVTAFSKSSTPWKVVAKTPAPKDSEGDDDSDTGKKVVSRKKKNEKAGKMFSTPLKSPSKDKLGKKAAKGKENSKVKDEELKPSDDELRDAICAILKEVDFNTATFTDILKRLAGRFDTDLTSRKSSIKVMIQEELTKSVDEADDEDGEGDAEKEENQSAGKEVEGSTTT